MIILKSNTAECLYSTYNNYTSCQDTTATDRTVDTSLIRTIYPPYDSSFVTAQDLALEAVSGKVILAHLIKTKLEDYFYHRQGE